MPTFQGQVSEEEIIALIAFIQSLKRGETPPRVEDYPPPTGHAPDHAEIDRCDTAHGQGD